MALKKKDLLDINDAINALVSGGTAKSKNLVYALIKNTKALEPEVTALNKALETDSDEFKLYVEDTRKVYTEFVDVDENGNFKTVPGGLILKDPESREEVAKQIAALDEQYADAIAARTVEIEKYNEILEEESDVVLTKIKLEHLPDEIDPRILFVLEPIIEA